MSQPANAEHVVYMVVKEYEGEKQIYCEMHTADWWCTTQVLLALQASRPSYGRANLN